MQTNNFQKWQNSLVDKSPDFKVRVKKKLDNKMDMYKFMGAILDLYVPKVVQCMQVALENDKVKS